jgi:hypothetical protein
MGREVRELSFHINAPVDRVFDFCADFEATAHAVSPRTRITEVSPGPLGVGTVVRYANDRFGFVGRTEVVEYSPPHTLVVEAVVDGRGPFRTITVVEAAEEGGSTVHFCSNTKPFIYARWMRPFAWVFAPYLRRVEAKANARFEEAARRALEAGPEQPLR